MPGVRLHKHGRRYQRRARGAVRARRDSFVLPQRGDILAWSAWDASTVSTPVRTNITTSLGMGVLGTPGGVGCGFSESFLLDAGTYSITTIHRQHTDRGIYTVTVDGVAAGTFDGYAATTDNVVSTITGLVLSAGRHTVTFTMATKNASSSGYLHAVASVTATRTAA